MKSALSLFLVMSLATAAHANVVGSDHQNFNPTTSGLDFVTVQSGQTLDPGILNVGFFLNYAVNTLSFLKEANPQNTQNKSDFNDTLFSADLNVGFGLAKNWDIGLSLPVLLSQDIENDIEVAYFKKTGNTEQRVNAKYRFYEKEKHSAAAVFSVNRNNIDNNPYVGDDAGFIYNLELATSWMRGSWTYGANIGHRWRDSGSSLSSTFKFDPIPNQAIASIAASHYIERWDTKWIIEMFGSVPTESTKLNLSNRDYSNLELLSGLKWDKTKNLALHAGAGIELMEGFGTPDYRLYAGLNYTMGPLYKERPAEPVVEIKPEVAPESERDRKIRSFVLTNLKFKFDSDELEQESIEQVDKVIAIIRDIGKFDKLTIEGHTDSLGNDDYNLRLSQRRADAIKARLYFAFGGDAKRYQGIGYGESKPIADNGNFQGRAANRRVVVTVYADSMSKSLSK